MKSFAVIGMILFLLAMMSCAPSRYVPEDAHLLGKNKIETSKKIMPENQYKGYILQQPNRRLLGVRFHLFLYNLSNINKDKWPHNWLRRIGEEPVIYIPDLTEGSVDRLSQYLENKGYYNAEISDSTKYDGVNAKVTYDINPNEPCIVRSIDYNIVDTGLVSTLYADTINSLLSTGMVFDKDILQEERLRIETLLRENGYFNFSREYVSFQADINQQRNAVDLVININQYIDASTTGRGHIKYMIDDVYVYPDMGSMENITQNISNPVYDTVLYNDQYFLSEGRSRIKPSVVTNTSYILPGEIYNLSNVNRTYRNLSEIGLIRFTNITFREEPQMAGDQYGLLNCYIELAQKKVQSYQIELAGTNSGGDLGIRGNLSYQNLNLFRGAETFNLRFTGAIEALKNRSNKEFTSMQELGVQANVEFPKFFSPFRLERFVRRYSPRTSISVSYNYQSRPDYTRSIANSSFSYRWNSNQYISHTISPFEINYVQIYESRSSSSFIDSMQNTPIGYSFEDHLVNTARYGFELNNQLIGQTRNFLYLRYNVESAGNVLHSVHNALNDQESSDPRQLFNVPYFQYLRSDIDLRHYNVFNRDDIFVSRIYLGLGYAYGNSATLPYEKKFFSGGPNSIRAWSSRDLGPGSYAEPDSIIFNFPNKTGDLKLEANVEYRFNIVWKMEGALFVDAGNIWSLRDEPDRPDALFRWDRFYKEIAVGTGFGVRFDFSFFLLRLDFGLKVRDPALPMNDRWIPVIRDFNLSDLKLKFGIGYPF